MENSFDFSEMMARTRAVQVILDRPRFMRFSLPAMAAFEAKFGVTFAQWIREVKESKRDVSAEDQYYIVWLGFMADDPELTLGKFCEMVPWPTLQSMFSGPVTIALTGNGNAEGNSRGAASAGRLPSTPSRGTFWGWILRKRGRQPQKRSRISGT